MQNESTNKHPTSSEREMALPANVKRSIVCFICNEILVDYNVNNYSIS